LFRNAILVTYVDPDNHELLVTEHGDVLPRVGENVRIAAKAYVVERVGYDLPEREITHVWVVCRRA
jgi:hypothetical protein